MNPDLPFLEGDPAPVDFVEEPAEVFELSDTDIRRLMDVDGVEGVWTRQEPIGSEAVIVAISKGTARANVPSMVAGHPVEFEFTGPIHAQTGKK